MNRRIIVRKNDQIISGLFEEKELIQLDLSKKDRLLGAIYIGKVKHIAKNIQAAFIEIGDGQIVYYNLNKNPLPLFTKATNGNQVCIGDELVIQIEKEAMKTKEPVATSKWSINGRYVICVYGQSFLHFSSKIKDAAWKKEIKEMIEPLDFSDGILIRTNAQYVSKEELKNELCQIHDQLETIKRIAIYRTAYTCLYKPESDYLTAIRDTYSNDLGEIITDDAEIFEELKQYFEQKFPNDVQKLRYYDDLLLPLEKQYRFNIELGRLLNRQVWLKSGAYLIIEPTETLIAIDVNTGKAINGKQSEETFLKINLEAAKEIARQLRLRNLSGMILIDFINMKSSEYRVQLMEALQRFVASDPVKTVVVDITKLNLVEVTRKKEKPPLYELLSKEY
ncbi:MAG: ribonuclease E/G [Clostridiales bacterium]|nr:ribonuclease E/G [Clostridiales bacterium]